MNSQEVIKKITDMLQQINDVRVLNIISKCVENLK